MPVSAVLAMFPFYSHLKVFFLFFFLLEVELIYNAVLVSGVQQK